ncbi:MULTISPECIES: hypothetical protein [unclassified Enterococcus]|uniref:hypothetical protein n=1 Tax=unclassified Enterococcus TaxID=2608891 RepID=UPI001551AEF4|nr:MULTISPECIES: hypothetical protein [unclassified Enterococcus]MBS7578097.1 hypothetical protein [Enterococcus sp. MMGLQ5-2]MBS7585357.1 hypothetical protein [Enterococcus sp. MMGLQ5-1]NPD13214.1 hypothetical protein [Enterococcus sp. MMGLQ5-1]NPD37928.1 hypothetical protein [Enterococcus sp. MMGLQ5-2]
MKIKKSIIFLIISSILLFIVKTVYNYFGHGVTSDAMNRIWIYPLVLLPILVILFVLNRQLWSKQQIKYVTRSLTVAMFTYVLGQFLTGVFEIAGTSSEYLIVYSILSGALSCFGLLLWMVLSFKQHHHQITASRS